MSLFCRLFFEDILLNFRSWNTLLNTRCWRRWNWGTIHFCGALTRWWWRIARHRPTNKHGKVDCENSCIIIISVTIIIAVYYYTELLRVLCPQDIREWGSESLCSAGLLHTQPIFCLDSEALRLTRDTQIAFERLIWCFQMKPFFVRGNQLEFGETESLRKYKGASIIPPTRGENGRNERESHSGNWKSTGAALNKIKWERGRTIERGNL